MKGEIERQRGQKMVKSEKIIKKKLLENYCQAKRSSILAELRVKLGDDLTIALLDNFSGRLIYIPNKSSLRRAALPMLIKEELRGFDPGTSKFKTKVKALAEFYKITQKAVKKINQKGIYTR